MGIEFTPEEVAEEEARRRRETDPSWKPPKDKGRTGSRGLDTGDGGPVCPKCGGTQFKARRTVGQRLGIAAVGTLTLPLSAGAGALAAAKGMKQKVQCITCGTFYARLA